MLEKEKIGYTKDCMNCKSCPSQGIVWSPVILSIQTLFQFCLNVSVNFKFQCIQIILCWVNVNIIANVNPNFNVNVTFKSNLNACVNVNISC